MRLAKLLMKESIECTTYVVYENISLAILHREVAIPRPLISCLTVLVTTTTESATRKRWSI